MAEVKITYETLFDLLRREKSRNELQQLDSSFYMDVVSYIREKKATLRPEEHHTLLFSRAEQEKIKIQIHNIQKILRELYEMREKKIINLSMNKVRTESNLIDTSSLLPEEISLFNETCALLSKYKEGVLNKVISMELPVVDFNQTPPLKKEYVVERQTEEKQKTPESESLFDSIPKSEAKDEPKFAGQGKKIKVRILNDLPKFMGQDKNIYGPYLKQEETELPEDITNILLKKGRVETI